MGVARSADNLAKLSRALIEDVWIAGKEGASYIENVLGEQARDVFEARASVSDRTALVDLYLNRIDQLAEQIPNADLRFVGKELRAYGERWRRDVIERISAGGRWTRAGAE